MPILRSKNLLWILTTLLLILNLIPISYTSNSLSANKLFVFRLDYLVHSFIFLTYAWLFVWSRIHRIKWFARLELPKYIALILSSALVFEFVQLLVGWRTFNPVDLYYNLIGSTFAIAFILLSSLLSRGGTGR
ncbi:MAG: hypothetical protein PWP64_1242 [Candidatus Cloacimonadota bacterium]|nr:hypothetical protein [Candidatus Cloacimonadota bacterium]